MTPSQSIPRTPLPPTDERKHFGLRTTAVALAVVLAGCVSTAGIESGARALTPREIGLPAVASTAPAVGAQWWQDLGDARLSGLVERSLAAHPSLKVAQARLAKAAAGVAIQEAGDGPRVVAGADSTRQHFSANSIYPAPLGGSIRTLANAQLAGSWELDFFGQHGAAIAAAVGSERAAQADLAAARQLLATQLVQAYVQWAQLADQREVTQRALAQREEMLGLIRERVSAGLDSQVELRLGEGALPETRLQLEQLDERIASTRLAIAALAAMPLEQLDGPHPTLRALKAARLPDQLPADLLGRRADITAARWRMEAATAGVKVARAQFYPNINLTAFAGLSSIGLGQLVESGSRHYGIGPAIHLPIFDAGALRAQLRGKTADLDAAIETYNGAILDAVREAADQLNVLRSIARQQAEQAQAQAAAESAYEFARQRYAAGLTGHLTLIQAETAVLAQRRQALDLRARALSAQAALARALGGGHQAPTELAAMQPESR